MHPAIVLIQKALPSLGYDAGLVNGFWNPPTMNACAALYEHGAAKESEWAWKTLQRGLEGLGYYTGAIDGDFGPNSKAALAALIDADGLPRASIVVTDEILTPTKPKLAAAGHGNVMRQGKAGHVVDTFCQHCGALPGDWHKGKSNAEMGEGIRQMHLARGWRTWGYSAIVFPDGEWMTARPWDQVPAGARGYNRGVFHLLMIETKTITKIATPEEYFSQATLDTAKSLIAQIGAQTPLRRLMGHNEVASKLCPGFEVIDHDWTDLAVA